MRAAIYHEFNGPIRVRDVPEPEAPLDGVIISVAASGLCRSDLYAWEGLEPDIELPHVPGHELAGVVAAVGRDVLRWKVRDRVTVPFSLGCGACPQCDIGNDQVCDNQYQPGFSGWGSLAELVAIPHADRNLVALPDEIDFTAAALLGCRFGTAYRAVVERGRVGAGVWVAVHGCGGLGLSAVMIAAARHARVIAVDIDDAALDLARSIGAEAAINATAVDDVPAAIAVTTGAGVHLSLDCLGSPTTAADSVGCLRKLGRHVQVGLLHGRTTPLPMSMVVAGELEIVGSHGIAATSYSAMLADIAAGDLDPTRLITRKLSLDEYPDALPAMKSFGGVGVAVVDRF